MTVVSQTLARRVEDGLLSADLAQAAAARELDAVIERLNHTARGGWFRKPKPARGLYMWGGVGRGKSMLMDMFFVHSPVKAKRVHFHEFMARVHDRLTAARGRKDVGDPIPPVAKQFAAEAKLICFDEFQVTQIADAMILSRLFEELFERGVSVIATSNRHPDDLYKHGINRELFTPFIDLLRQRCVIFELASERDYRLERLTEAPVWHVGVGPEALDTAFDRLTLGAAPQSCALTVQGRKLIVQREAAGVARFTFEELCVQPLGPRDYLTIAATFHTVLLDNIPVLSPENRDEAARFVALIDALYEAKVKLVASAAAKPEALYREGKGSFEFKRTASRLHEMRSNEYIAAEHVAPAIGESSA